MTTRFDTMSPCRQRALLGGVIFALIVLALGLLEVAVRIRQALGAGNPVFAVEELFRTDEQLDLRIPVANYDNGRVRINALGFRGPELRVPKPAGVIRIAFVGASTTFCSEVSSNAMAWPELSVTLLSRDIPTDRLDFINAAVPGYTLDAAIKNLETRVLQLEPDIVVFYEATNELPKHTKVLATRQGFEDTNTDLAMSWPAQYSNAWYLIEKNVRAVLLQRASQSYDRRLEFSDDEIAAPYRANLQRLYAAARRSAKNVAFVTFSTRLRPEQSVSQRAGSAATSLYYMPYMSLDGLIRGFSVYNNTLRSVATETGATVIEAESAIPGDGEHFVDSVHFSDRGSQRMAEIVAAGLRPVITELLKDADAQSEGNVPPR